MIEAFEGRLPVLGEKVLVSPTAAVVGDVTVGEGSSIWYSAVVRGDVQYVRIGRFTSIQDGAIVHTASESVGGKGRDYPAVIGDYVTVGHGAILHACTVGDRCLIGMNAVVLDGAVIGEGSIVAAGAVVTGGTVIPPRSMVMGVPGKVTKTLPEESLRAREDHAMHYHKLALKYL